METSTAGVTVREADPLTAPSVAVTVAGPCATVLARPLLPVALLIVTPGTEETQVAAAVRFSVLPSLYRPVAVNC